MEIVGSIYFYVREKNFNKFLLYLIEKLNDIEGFFGVILRIFLIKLFLSLIRIKINFKDEDI